MKTSRNLDTPYSSIAKELAKSLKRPDFRPRFSPIVRSKSMVGRTGKLTAPVEGNAEQGTWSFVVLDAVAAHENSHSEILGTSYQSRVVFRLVLELEHGQVLTVPLNSSTYLIKFDPVKSLPNPAIAFEDRSKDVN